MEENRKLIIAALVVMLGGNTGNIISSASPKNYRPDPFTGLDGSKLRADMLQMYNSHYLLEMEELEKIRHRISKCEFKLSPPSIVYSPRGFIKQ